MDTERIGLLLRQKGAVKPCQRCDHMKFTVLDGFNKIILQSDFREGLAVDGASVPVVNVACGNCGAITAHAIGAFGLKLDDPAPDVI